MKVLYFNSQKIKPDNLQKAMNNLCKIYPKIIALPMGILKLEDMPLENLIVLRDSIDKIIKKELRWEDTTND